MQLDVDIEPTFRFAYCKVSKNPEFGPLENYQKVFGIMQLDVDESIGQANDFWSSLNIGLQ